MKLVYSRDMNREKAKRVTLGKSEALFVTTPNGRITVYTGSFVNGTDKVPHEIVQIAEVKGHIRAISSDKRKGVKA